MKTYNIVLDKPSVTWVITKGIDSRIDSEYYSSIYLKKQLIEQENPLDYCELGSLGKGFSYGTPPYGNMAEQGVPYLRIPNIEDQFFLNDDLAFINEDYHLKNIRNEVDKGDILFRIKGQLGQAVVVPKRYAGAHTGSSFLKFTPTFIDPYFLVLYLSSSYGKNQILRKQSNSIIKYLNIDDIKSIKVPVPSPEIQKYIGDKVRRAEELREEAKRLKEEAESLISNSINLERLVEKVRDYKSKNNWVDSASISGRIDGQYYINPITEINKYMKNIDMKLVVLRDIAEVRKGFSYSNESSNGVPYIRISDLDDLLIDYSKVVRIDNKTYQQKRNSQLKYFDLIMAITGATIGKVSVFYNKEIEKATLSADTAYVRFNNIEDSIAYLLYFKTVIGQLAITQGITGATNKHLAIEDIKNIVLPQFEDSIKKEVKNKIVQSMDNIYTSKQLIQEAKQDVEDLIEGDFEMSELNNNSSTESRC